MPDLHFNKTARGSAQNALIISSKNWNRFHEYVGSPEIEPEAKKKSWSSHERSFDHGSCAISAEVMMSTTCQDKICNPSYVARIRET
jgi:hypothetical protein